MAEDSKTKSTQAKESTTKPTTTTKSQTDSKTKITAVKEDKALESLALSVQPKTRLPQNRPIEPSQMEITNTYSSVGSNRPVTKGTVDFASSLVVSGNRPIAVSTLKVTESYMGNRPVASNESDDTATLLEYLD